VKRKPDFKIQAYEKGKRTFQWTSAFGYFCRNHEHSGMFHRNNPKCRVLRKVTEKLKTNFNQNMI